MRKPYYLFVLAGISLAFSACFGSGLGVDPDAYVGPSNVRHYEIRLKKSINGYAWNVHQPFETPKKQHHEEFVYIYVDDLKGRIDGAHLVVSYGRLIGPIKENSYMMAELRKRPTKGYIEFRDEMLLIALQMPYNKEGETSAVPPHYRRFEMNGEYNLHRR